MRRKIFYGALAALAVVFFATACLGYIGKQTYPFTMKDMWKNSIKFTKPPERVVSCMPSITEILFALDLGKKIVGVTENCNYPSDAKKIEKVGRDQMNLEKIVSLKPDLIVMLADAQSSDIKKFKSFGLPIFVVEQKTVRDVMYSITLVGEATNREHAAYAITQAMQRKLNWVAVRVGKSGKKRPRVFVEVWHKPLITVSNDTFLNDVIERAGGVNIAKNAREKYPEFSFEKLLAEDPDVIIIPRENVPDPNSIYNDGRWKKLKAVINKRVLFIDADIMSRPGPRVISAIEEISSFLYEWEGVNESKKT